jgi:hypothetical protein
VNATWDPWSIVRYAAIALFGAIALRSLIRLLRRSVNASWLVASGHKFVAAGQYARLARLLEAGKASWVALLAIRALSLHIPKVGHPRGQPEHFRNAPEPIEPFEVAWKRAMDSTHHALRREVLTDLGAAIGSGALAALIASLGAYLATDRGSFAYDAAIAAAAMLIMFFAANSGRKTLDGLVLMRRFCESLAQPTEQWDDDRREAGKLAASLWRARARASQGAGTDV